VGDQKYQNVRGPFNDAEFGAKVAAGTDAEFPRGLHYDSISKMSGEGELQVFTGGINAVDVRQGSLGDCYLLSAMSVIAHSRPELITKIFHPDSRVYRKDGMYHIMFYRRRSPIVITIDDKVFLNDD
jgi:hypothetical protein